MNLHVSCCLVIPRGNGWQQEKRSERWAWRDREEKKKKRLKDTLSTFFYLSQGKNCVFRLSYPFSRVILCLASCSSSSSSLSWGKRSCALASEFKGTLFPWRVLEHFRAPKSNVYSHWSYWSLICFYGNLAFSLFLSVSVHEMQVNRISNLRVSTSVTEREREKEKKTSHRAGKEFTLLRTNDLACKIDVTCIQLSYFMMRQAHIFKYIKLLFFSEGDVFSSFSRASIFFSCWRFFSSSLRATGSIENCTSTGKGEQTNAPL